MGRSGFRGMAALALLMTGPAAWAQSTTTTSTTQTAPAPVAAPAQPVAVAAPVQAAPVSSTSKQVVADTHQENFMLTIMKDTFYGALAGGIIGGAVYILGDQNQPKNIAYWGAGGALVGATAGVIEVAVRRNDTERALSSMERKSGRGPIAFVPRVASLRW